MPQAVTKDPDANLDYAFDWNDWLVSGDSISSFEVTATGVTVANPIHSAGKIIFWLTGGTDGTSYSVKCHIHTVQGRVDDRTMTIKCKTK